MEKNTKYTRDLYNKFAKKYAESVERGRFYNKYIELPAVEKIFSKIKGKRILDAGCGTGVYSALFSAGGAKVYGIDISDEMIKLARQNAPAGIFKTADMKKLPFKNIFFDIVYFGLSIHYLKDMRPALKEAFRVLKKNGRIVISTHSPCNIGQKEMNADGKRVFVTEDYFGARTEKWNMVPGMLVINYVRTIGALLNPIAGAGFRITHISEPRPKASGRKINPVFYEKTTRAPSITIIEAIKYGIDK